MFEKLRSNMKLVIWTVIIAFVGTIFLAWGMHLISDRRQKDYIARVNGKKITHAEFYSQYQEWARRYREVYQEAFTEEMEENLRRMIFNSLIGTELAVQEARRNNIRASLREIKEAIKANPIFRNEKGEFDAGRYQQGLKALPKRWWREEEKRVERLILAQKMERYIEDSVKISPQEIEDYYLRKNTAVQIKYLLVPYTAFKISPDPGQVRAYYEKHKENYRREESRMVEYLSSPRPLPEDIPDTKTRISIMENIELTLDKALDALDKGVDFKTIADSYNLETGRTRHFERAQFFLNPEFREFARVAFTLQSPGDYSDIVESGRHYYILKLLERKRTHIPLLEEIEGEVRKDYVRSEQEDFARNKALEGHRQISKGESFQKFAKDKFAEIKQTPYFKRDTSLATISDLSQAEVEQSFKKEAFRLLPGEISRPLRLSTGYGILSVEDKMLPFSEQIDTFEEEWAESAKELWQRRSFQLLNEWYAALRQRAKIDLPEQEI